MSLDVMSVFVFVQSILISSINYYYLTSRIFFYTSLKKIIITNILHCIFLRV